MIHAGAKIAGPVGGFAVVVVGNFRNRAELRKKPRRQFHYGATIFIDKKRSRLPCILTDVSESGARILLESECDLPDRFVLLLTESGQARRYCRIVWRRGKTVGVAYADANARPTESVSASGADA